MTAEHHADRYWTRHLDDGRTETAHIPAGDPVEVDYAALALLLTEAGFVEDKLRGLVEDLGGGAS